MHRSLSFNAVVCLSTLVPSSLLYAAQDPQVEALKQELQALKQRYEQQQQALMAVLFTFIAGGVAQKLVKHLGAGTFRAQFENKGRLSYYVKAIPARLILNEDAAFLGPARASVEFRT